MTEKDDCAYMLAQSVTVSEDQVAAPFPPRAAGVVRPRRFKVVVMMVARRLENGLYLTNQASYQRSRSGLPLPKHKSGDSACTLA